LVAANRILAREKVLDGYGHISVRDLDTPGQYFISRSLAPELVTAGDIVALDVASSSPVASENRPLYLERFIHGSIYKARLM
jgi:ribulose-5-phosphate 4-epimerase/fuculose-1-phosphate aldolase